MRQKDHKFLSRSGRVVVDGQTYGFTMHTARGRSFELVRVRLLTGHRDPIVWEGGSDETDLSRLVWREIVEDRVQNLYCLEAGAVTLLLGYAEDKGVPYVIVKENGVVRRIRKKTPKGEMLVWEFGRHMNEMIVELISQARYC